MFWGHTWFNEYPDEPAHIVDALDDLLALHDKRLKYHLDSIAEHESPSLASLGDVSVNM